MPNVARHVAAALSHRIDHVFGVMGNGNAHLLDALERDPRIKFTPMRHEAGGVAAADAHFRASGRIAAATVTYGAGFTNTLTALAEAAKARTPMVVVAGDEPVAGPRPWDVDQSVLASAVGVRTLTAGVLEPAATATSAIEQALLTRRPVVLALPYDVSPLDAGTIPDPRPPRRPDRLHPAPRSAQRVSDIASALAMAERPLLLAGRGAWLAGAGGQLSELAAATGAVTATTALGRGIFAESRYDLGVTGGFGAPGAMELIGEADLVVAFGASLNAFTTRFGALFSPLTAVAQVDVTDTATHPRVGTFVRGDAALVARALREELAARRSVSSGWRESVQFAQLRAQERGEARAPDGLLDPRSVAARLGELLPENRVVVSDGGHFIGWANMYWHVAAPDRMIMVGTAFQTIGLGWPSMAGASAARPDATVVLTTGDGGGLMALSDLESAIRTAAGRGMAVVWNDAAYGAELNLYGLNGLAQAPMRIPRVDFAALGAALGAEGLIVTELTQLDRVAAWTMQNPSKRKFLVVDVRISPDIIAPYQKEIIEVNR